MSTPFKPAWWLPGGHAQTIFPALLRRRPVLPLDCETLELPDGDFVDLCWTGPGGGPIVALFHGLEGGIGSHYSSGMLAAIHAAGWQGVLMHFRGCSGRHNRLARSYHSGDTGDIGFLVKSLAQRAPDAPLAAIGFSLGGNALLKYLGETGNASGLKAAAVVSVPFQLAASADRLSRGLSRIYQRHLLALLRRKFRGKFAANDSRAGAIALQPGELARLDTFRLFDDAVTAPLHGFDGVDDYYRRSSCRAFLSSIRIPTLIVHALDDPFLPQAAVPAAAELAHCVSLELHQSGGHAGFVEGGVPWTPRYWLERRIPEFLQAHLD